VVCLNILITGAAIALLPVGAFGGALCLPRNTATVFLKQKKRQLKKKHGNTIHPNQKISPFFEFHRAFLIFAGSAFFAASSAFFFSRFAFFLFLFSLYSLHSCQKLEDKQTWLDLSPVGP